MSLRGRYGRLQEAVVVLQRQRNVVFAALIVLVVIKLWIAPLGSSLWLDETGTYWTVQHGLASTLSRSVSPPQSTLYYLLAAAAVAVGGASEVALRLPSLIAMLAGAVLLYRLGLRLLDPAAAKWAVLIFVCHEGIAFAAADARPYAFGLLVVIASTLMLVRWLQEGHTIDGAAYAGLAALIVYFHYLFGTILLVHAAYAAVYLRRQKRSLLTAAWIAVLTGTLMAPRLIGLARLAANAEMYSYAGRPDRRELLEVLLPSLSVGGVLLGLLAAYLTGCACRLSQPLKDRDSRWLLLCWAAGPPLMLFAVAVLTPAEVFVARYMLCAVPGFALLGGRILRAIESPATQIWVALGLTLSSLAVGAPMRRFEFTHGGEDWRGAMQAVRAITSNQQIPILMNSGFVEKKALDHSWSELEITRRLAPLSMYPSGGRPIPMPEPLRAEDQPYLEYVAVTRLESVDRFIYITHRHGKPILRWLEGRFSGKVHASQLGAFQGVDVYMFERRPDTVSSAPARPKNQIAATASTRSGSRAE